MALIQLEKRTPQPCIRIRHVGPYTEVGPSFQAVGAFVFGRGLAGPQTRVGGMAHDHPAETPAEELRYDAFVTVDAETLATLELPAEHQGFTVEVGELPGGEYATLLHTGSYEGLADAYAELFERWLPGSGRKPGEGPCLEFYLNDPQTTAPADLETLLCLPLAE